MSDHRIAAVIPAPLLELAVAGALGEGLPTPAVDREVTIPGGGAITVGLTIVIRSAEFPLVTRDDAFVPVTVHGEVHVGAAGGGSMPVPLPPLPVTVDALVQTTVELGTDQARLLVDLAGARFLDARVGVPEGPDAPEGFAQMAAERLAEGGEALLSGLGEGLGPVGIDITGLPLSDLGIEEGPALVRSLDGALLLCAGCRGLPRVPDAPANDRIAVTVGTDLLGDLAVFLGRRALGGVRPPFDLDVSTSAGTITLGLRNSRVFGAPIPDLRSGLAGTWHLRRTGEDIEFRFGGAWVELPGPLSLLDGIGRAAASLGSALVPVTFRVPASHTLDLPDGTALTLRVGHLAVGDRDVDMQVELVPG